MAVRGIFASWSGIIGDRVNNLSGKVLQKGFGGTTPLLALSSGMKEERATDTSWSWTEDSHISGNTTCPAGVASTVTGTMTVADSNLWVPNSIVMVEATGEHIFITAVTGNVVTFTRGFAGTTPVNIPAGGTLQLIGSAYEEGGGKPQPVSKSGESYTNLVQIFKNGWAVTGTAKAVQYLTGSKVAQNKEQCLAFHAEDIERSFFWGRKSFSTLNGKELRTSNGVLAQITDYGGLVVSAAYGGTGGNMSIAGLQDFMRQIFDRQVKGMPNERIVFTGSIVLNLIQTMVRKDSLHYVESATTEWGMNITTLNFLGNQLKFLTHPLMVENALWQHEMYVLHPGLITKKVLRDTWTQEFQAENNTNAGIDSDEGFIADELGFQLKGAELHGIMRNIQTAVAS